LEKQLSMILLFSSSNLSALLTRPLIAMAATGERSRQASVVARNGVS
jgi:hypothetical protein